MPKILIVGSSGYVGRALGHLLRCDHQVIGTYLHHPMKAEWEMIKLDIQDRQAVQNTIQRIKPNIIFHLAYRMDNLSGSIIEGTHNLVKAWHDRGDDSRFIFISTDIVFSGKHPPYRETDKPDPIVPYGKAKQEAERDVLAANGVVVRISLVYGFDPPDPRTVVLLKGFESGRFAYPYFKDEFRCPVHVDDVCRALAEIGFNTYDRLPIWHVAGPECISRYAFARKMSIIAGHDPEKVPGATLEGSGLMRPKDLSLDCTISRSNLQIQISRIGQG